MLALLLRQREAEQRLQELLRRRVLLVLEEVHDLVHMSVLLR